MRFFNEQHKHYCGVDLHAQSMYLCVLDQNGKVCLHKDMATNPTAFMAAIAPWRDDLVVGVECVFTWYWLADLCQREKIPFILGHALYMKAIHGAKAKNDRLDSKKLAVMLRGGAFPQAYVYPREMRATRDLLRRRHHIVRFRAELLAHIQNTNSQANLPGLGAARRSIARVPDVMQRFKDPMVRSSVEVDLEIIQFLDRKIENLERKMMRHAKRHQPNQIHLLRTVHGIGPVLALTILYEIQDIYRFPRVQEFSSYARLVTCAHESAGKRSGSGGRKIGNAHLKWAFSEAAVLFLRSNPEGMRYKNKLVRKHGKGKALSILAHRIGRSVYFMLKRNEVFDQKRFLAA